MGTSGSKRMNSNKYWNERYQREDTPWTLNRVSPPIQFFFENLGKGKKYKILIPGAGLGFEAQYLHDLGHEVHIVDISENAIFAFKNKFSEIPVNQIHCESYFDHIDLYDYIVEQTFFCALTPDLRKSYVKHTLKLLYPKGKLVGLFFDDVGSFTNPPFRVNRNEYQNLFEQSFQILKLETCYNSIKPRQGNELFFIFEKN